MTATPFLSERITKAIALAVRAHGKMKRKGDDQPYLVHPIAVFALLAKWGANEDTCIAGLLHDVIEDAEDDSQRATYRKEIAETFGGDVMEIVEEVTEQDKSLPWKTRKKQYIEHLRTASKESLLVSCADRTHNVASLVASYAKEGEKVWKRFNAAKEWQVWFIDQVVSVLRERLDDAYTTELCSHLKELNALLSRPLAPEHQSFAFEKTDQNGNKIFFIDPLYSVLRDHCALTEQELESGMLDYTKEALPRLGKMNETDQNASPGST